MKCMFHQMEEGESSCNKLYRDDFILRTYLDRCPEMFFIPHQQFIIDIRCINVETHRNVS